MERIFRLVSRRGVLKLFLALPLLNFLEKLLDKHPQAAETTRAQMKVGKVSDLKTPWSTRPFEYRLKVKTQDVYKKDVVIEETVPGLVVRLPDDVAQKRGGGVKARFEVIDLHCSHQRCVTALIADPKEAHAVADIEPKGAVVYCPCHRSVFDLTQEAKPIKGPAKAALWKFDFDVKGDDIVVTGIDPRASQWAAGNLGGLMSEYPTRDGEPGL
ncbi:MAG: Rieske (2Fe-2S) protein [Candidatus Binatia bacterium]